MSVPRRSARIAAKAAPSTPVKAPKARAVPDAPIKSNMSNLKAFMYPVDLERAMSIDRITAATACVNALHTDDVLNTNGYFRNLICKKLNEFLEDVLPCEFERILKWTPDHINTTEREGALFDLQEACESLDELVNAH